MAPATQTRVSPEERARSFDVEVFRLAYDRGVNVSQLLEQEDPTLEREEAERGLDAFERVLRAAGIVTNPIPEMGIEASTYGEATDTPQKRAMMMEWAARVWRSTRQMSAEQKRAILLSGDAAINTLVNQYFDDTTPRTKRLVAPIPLNLIVARSTGIRGTDYRSLYIVDDLNTDAYRLKRVMEGAEIPKTTLVTGEHTIQIHKFGRALLATYEQLRRQRLDRIAFIIQRMALQAEVDKVSDALNTIVNGDGNANTAATVLALTALDTGAVAGTLTLKGWLTFKARFTNAYVPDVVLGTEASILQLLMLPVNTVNGIPLILLPGNDFGSLRNIGTRFGAAIGYGMTADAPALKLVTFDSANTLEEVNEIGGNVSEVERYITNQTQVMTLTEVTGFAIIDANGSKVLNINA